MKDASQWNRLSTFSTVGTSEFGNAPSGWMDVFDVFDDYDEPFVARRLLSWVRHSGIFRRYDRAMAIDGVSDTELQRLAGPLGGLSVDDVRWDTIGGLHGSRRR
jgi:hypothetical protein